MGKKTPRTHIRFTLIYTKLRFKHTLISNLISAK